jgi:ribonuclease VapC
MIVDSSALAAILFREPEAERFAVALCDAAVVRISAATLVEVAIVVVARLGSNGSVQLGELLTRLHVVVEPFTGSQAGTAHAGWLRFGRGRHPAALNFGDSFAYALAIEMDEPLLFSGADFARTDVRDAFQQIAG